MSGTPWLIPDLGIVRRYRRARYRAWAWLDRLTGWGWVKERAWDAVFALHADALAAEADRLEDAGCPRCNPQFRDELRGDVVPAAPKESAGPIQEGE